MTSRKIAGTGTDGLVHRLLYNVGNDTVTDQGLIGGLSYFPGTYFTGFFANLFSISKEWRVAGSRYVLRRSKQDTPFFSGISLPVCIWTVRMQVETCSRSRIIESAADAIGIDPVTGKGGYKWRVSDQGPSIELETTGGDETAFTPEELTVLPNGLAIANWRGMAWRTNSGIQGAPGNNAAAGAACCDLSPLPP
jgi:hypothetical protein